jgi:cysteine-rich repeat protein
VIARLVVLTLFVTSACVGSEATHCGDLVCPAGTLCAPYQGLSLCVQAEQVVACNGLADRAPCVAAIEGTCHGGACLPIGCGNGSIDDPLYGTGEECDDHNRLSHDGCSSTCKIETARWDDSSAEPAPRIFDHAMAYDTTRDQVFMFGGADYGGLRTDWTRELGSEAWVQVRQPITPSARTGHAVANDGHRRKVVMFGGSRGVGQDLADTWEWDGASWALRRPALSPSARRDHAMAHDPIRKVIVLFGGRAGSTDLDDTWEWNGETWASSNVATRPPARSGHAMAYDAARGTIVLVGEASAGVVDTWEYDGTDWTPIPMAGARPPGRSIAMAFDPTDRLMILHGGIAGPSSETWTWDGTTWGSRTLPIFGRFDAALASDPVLGHVVLHGGRDTTTPQYVAFDDTWRWNGAGWQVVPRRPSMAERVGHDAVLDHHRGRIVVYGGTVVSSNLPTTDTGELGGAGWEISTSVVPNPGARIGHAMAYDAARRQTVLFGGADDHTWLWDGATWTERITVGGPPDRVDAAMAYDAARGVVVMFGGNTLETPPVVLEDVWEWNGTTWTEIHPEMPRPSRRSLHALAYDPIARHVVLFGGYSNRFFLDDTWSWNGQTWKRFESVQNPTKRAFHGLAWDPTRQRLLLLGGVTPTGNGQATDVWEWDGADWLLVSVISALPALRIPIVSGLDGSGTVAVMRIFGDQLGARRLRWSATGVYESCRLGDPDRDGLHGCDDPDCWAQCTPACPPGVTCDVSEPHCNDQTCSSIETPQACPADCGLAPALCGDFVCSAGEDCPGDCGW